MFDAGSVVVTLAGRVIRDGFVDFGKLAAAAKLEKDHTMVLGAVTVSEGFDKFMAQITGVTSASREAAVGIDANVNSITASVDRMATSAQRSLKLFDDALYGVDSELKLFDDKIFVAKEDLKLFDDQLYATAGNLDKLAGSASASADKVASNAAKASDAAKTQADQTRAANDAIVQSNAKVVESHSAVADAAAGGAAAGGRRGGGGAAARRSVAQESEDNAKKTTAAWTKGYNSLANIGKWVTFGVLGIGALSVKTASDFQRQMELLNTQAGYAQKSVDVLSKKVENLAGSVEYGPTKLATALFHIASSGIPASKAMDVLRTAAKGAQVGQADLESTANALVAIMRTAPKDIRSSSEAMAVMTKIVGEGNLRMQDLNGALTTGILPAAKAVGLGMRDVGAAIDVMTSRGIPAQEGATRLRTVLSLIANPTTKAQKALDELGYSGHRLAEDFRKKGLVGALTDLHDSMGKIFGHKLDEQQMEAALKSYATQLQNSGASAATITKDVEAFHTQLMQTGSGAIQSSQLIADAFGGARMGTTMQILMQNIDDVNKHMGKLNDPHILQEFDKAVTNTQKDFSVKAGETWASVQKLATSFGTWLIPKLEATAKALVTVAHWLGEHKKLADALAIAFGTVLTAAVVAFFARLLTNAGRGIKSIFDLGKAIFNLPKMMAEAATKMKAELQDVAAQADETAGAVGGIGKGMGGAASAGGGGGGVLGEEAAGGILNGMIVGFKNSPQLPGSAENPIAVVVMAGDPMGASGTGAGITSKTEEELAAETQATAGASAMSAPSRGASLLQDTARVAPEAALASEVPSLMMAGTSLSKAGEQVGPTIVDKVRSGLGSAIGGLGTVMSRVMSGAMIAGIGTVGAQTIGSIVGGKVGKDISSIGTGASFGAALGSAIEPGIGTAVGAALGAGFEGLRKLGIFGGGPSHSQVAASHAAASSGVRKGLSVAGVNTNQFSQTLQSELDGFYKLTMGQKTINIGDTGRQGQESIHLAVNLDTASGQKAATLATTIGHQISSALVAGWSQDSIHKEVPMFADFKKAATGMPQYAQGKAAEMVLAYTKELAANGKLPLNSVDQMFSQMKGAFPGMVKYMGSSAADAIQAYQDGLQVGKVEGQVAGMITNLSQTVEGFPPVVNETATGIQQTWSKSWTTLEQDANSSVTSTRTQARLILEGMVTDAQRELPNLPTLMGNLTKNGKQALATNLGQALAVLQNNMSDMGTATAKGMRKVEQELSHTLKKLGYSNTALDSTVSSASTQLINRVSTPVLTLTPGGSGLPGRAGGGYAPGAEFGLGDQMTLVDPNGVPRARMAGDEAIFTRHQMPYIEAGLQAIGMQGGSAQLWNTVNRPHGYAIGGLLKAFATGGKVVTASDYGGPKDPSVSQTKPIGYHGDNLFQHPDSYAELDMGTALGGLPYMAPLDVTYKGRTARLYKRDIGAGGPGVDGYPRAIDLWYQAAESIGFPYPGLGLVGVDGTGGANVTVRGGKGQNNLTSLIIAPKATGTGESRSIVQAAINEATAAANAFMGMHTPTGLAISATMTGAHRSVPVTSTVGAPAGLRSMILEANAIASNNYNYEWGGGHQELGVPGHGSGHGSGPGVGFDCSGAVSAVLGAAGLVSRPMVASQFANFGDPGPGKYVTIYDSNDHVYMSLLGHYFGTSTAENPGGGANWIPTFPESMPVIRHPTGYARGGFLPRFAVGGSLAGASLLANLGVSSVTFEPARGGGWKLDQTKLPKADQIRLKENAGAILPGFATGGSLTFYAGGGEMGRRHAFSKAVLAHAASGKPYAPVSPGYSTSLPGHRPARPRQGVGGIHTIGGTRGGGLYGGSKGKSNKPKQATRSVQSLSQTVKNYLNQLGLGSFTLDQTRLGQLDTDYTNDDNLYTTFNPNGLTSTELATLMGIREEEWDILYNEYIQLPKAISFVQSHLNALKGSVSPIPGYTGSTAGLGHQGLGVDTSPTKLPSGIEGTVAEINADDNLIVSLNDQLNKEHQRVLRDKHTISGDTLTLAGKYASQVAVYTDQKNAIIQRQIAITNQIEVLDGQSVRITSSSATANPTTAAGIAQGVASGTLTAAGTASRTQANKIAKAGIAVQKQQLTATRTALTNRSKEISIRLKTLLEGKDATALKDRTKAFQDAWVYQTDAFKVKDKVINLRAAVKKLKELLAKEKARLAVYGGTINTATDQVTTATSGTLQTLLNWLNGNTQGQASVLQSLGSEGYNIMDLYQQGANLPSPYPSGYKGHRPPPILSLIEAIMEKAGISVPPDITQNSLNAQAFADFQAFQANRAALFNTYGSNFAPAGVNPFGNAAGLGAGAQYYGAAAGPTPGAGAMAGGGVLPGYSVGGSLEGVPQGPGDTTININQHFAAGPPDPHTYAAGLGFELQGQM